MFESNPAQELEQETGEQEKPSNDYKIRLVVEIGNTFHSFEAKYKDGIPGLVSLPYGECPLEVVRYAVNVLTLGIGPSAAARQQSLGQPHHLAGVGGPFTQ